MKTVETFKRMEQLSKNWEIVRTKMQEAVVQMLRPDLREKWNPVFISAKQVGRRLQITIEITPSEEFKND